MLLLLLLLSRFSRVRLCVTPQTAAHQAPLSLGFSRQEHWNGLPFPSPMHESESEVAQSCSTLSDPMDCSLPGFSVHGIFQARVLEWGAIAFSRPTLLRRCNSPVPAAPCRILPTGGARGPAEPREGGRLLPSCWLFPHHWKASSPGSCSSFV